MDNYWINIENISPLACEASSKFMPILEHFEEYSPESLSEILLLWTE
jgi:hypothetical protein